MYPIDASPRVVDVISAGETAPNTTPVMLLTFRVKVLIDFVMSCCVDTCASKAISFHSTEILISYHNQSVSTIIDFRSTFRDSCYVIRGTGVRSRVPIGRVISQNTLSRNQ